MEYSFQKRDKDRPRDSDPGINRTKDRSMIMNQEEMSLSIKNLEAKVSSISDKWEKFLSFEMEKRELEKRQASDDAERWQNKQKFLNKHGAKLATFIFALISSGLAWYGSQIKSDIEAEDKARQLDTGIEANKRSFEKFKEEEFAPVKKDIENLQLDSVYQTIMIEKGFGRLDKTIMKAYPKVFPTKDSLPDVDPGFEKTAKEAGQKKMYYEKFGRLPPEE